MFWLIGMMGVGKSSAGRDAALRLDLPFWDTDSLVEMSAGMTVSEIFFSHGESEFRRLERDAFESVRDETGVFSAGGGAPMDPANAQIIGSGDSVVWLACDVQTLVQRVGKDSRRPLLGNDPGATLESLLAARERTYSGLATTRIDTADKNIDEVVDELVTLWNN